MIFNLCSHAFTVSSKFFVVICEDKKTYFHVKLHTRVIVACVSLCSFVEKVHYAVCVTLSENVQIILHELQWCVLSVTKRNMRLTVCAQGSCQHLNTLVSDGISGSKVRGQWTPSRSEAGRHGAGWGGGSFSGISFAFSARKVTSQQSHAELA